MWKSVDEQQEDLKFVKKRIYDVLDAMKPYEKADWGQFRDAVHSLCEGTVDRDFVELGLSYALEDHVIEFSKERFMMEVQAGDDTWDNRLSGDSEDDTRWSVSLNRSRSVIKTS